MGRSEGRFSRETAALDEFELEAWAELRSIKQRSDVVSDDLDLPEAIPTIVDAPWTFLSRCIQLGSLAYENSSTALRTAVEGLGMQVAQGESQYHTSQAFWANGHQMMFDGAAHAAVLGDRVYISFQGTEPSDFGDLTTDVLFALFSGPNPLDPESLIIESYAAKFRTWVDSVVERYPGHKFVFVGHSLGGMVAETFTHWGMSGEIPGLSSANTYGVAFGSPGVSNSWAQAPSEHFFHISREQDAIGWFNNHQHIGRTLWIDDPESNSLPGMLEHNHWRYAEQLEEIEQSPLARYLSFAAPIRFLADNSAQNVITTTNEQAVFGGEFRDAIYAGEGAGSLLADGGSGNDLLEGLGADDILSGGAGDDLLMGGSGSDRLFGGTGEDRIFGGTGSDHIDGGSHRDTLYGGQDNDSLAGGNDDDFLAGEGGSDVLNGGAGNDTAQFDKLQTAYHFYRDGGRYLVKDKATLEVDELILIEVLRFADNTSVDFGRITWSTSSTPPGTPPPPLPPPPPPPVAPPTPGDDYGNSRGSAATTTAGQTFFGAIETLRDQDWFAINLTAGGVYGFAMSGASVNGRSALSSPHLYLYNAAGDLLTHGSPASVTSLFSYTAQTTGTFYLQARAHGDTATGAYVISSSRNGTAPTSPPDDEDDAPERVRLDLDAVEDRGEEDGAQLIYRVEYRGDLTEDIQIGWEIRGTGDHPTNALDFVYTSGAVTLREVDDDGYVTIRVTMNEDHIDEFDETFELSIHVISGDATISDDDAWGTILDDDEGRIHPDIDEHGDTPGTATRGSEETWHRGFITTVGDVDFFAFSVVAGATYEWRVIGDDDTSLIDGDEEGFIRLSDPQAALYDSNFNVITSSFNEPFGRSTWAEYEFTATTTGTYYLAVREDGDNDIGQYFARMEVVHHADDFAGNASTTGRLVEGELAEARNEREGDVDWFRITMTAGESYSVFAIATGWSGTFIWPGDTQEFEIRIRDAAGNSLAGATEPDGINNGQYNQLTFVAPTTGDYFISVANPDSHDGDEPYVVGFNSVGSAPSSQPVVFQPGPAAGFDAFFRDVQTPSEAGTNSETLQVGGFWGGNGSSASALRFNLEALPQEAEYAAVEIYLSGVTQNGSSTTRPPISMMLGALTAEWDEASSYSTIDGYDLQSWLSAPAGPGWYRIEITDLYNQWQDGSRANYGFSLLPVDSHTTTNSFYSSDYLGDATLRPRLVVHERSPEEIRGTSGHETVVGTTRADILRGLAGDDLISGDRGADVLDGGLGSDFMNGGDGFDTATYANSAAAVQVNLEFNEATGGEAEGDSLINIENLVGSSFADILIGNHDANSLQGGAGNDRLLGGLGDDLLNGGLGNDWLDGGSGHDILTVSGIASSYRLLMDGDNFILKGPDGGDWLTNVESIRFSDGRVLELNRMYGPDVDTRAWSDGRIPEALLSGGAWSGDRPLVLPGPAGDDFLTAKDGGGPEVLPAADDWDGWVWKDADAPLVLPGADDVFVVAKGFDGPEVLPGVDDWTPAGAKGFDQPEVLPGMDERTMFTFDRMLPLDRWSGQMLRIDEQGLVVDHYAPRGGWGPDGWLF